jgi:hypothetical protein
MAPVSVFKRSLLWSAPQEDVGGHEVGGGEVFGKETGKREQDHEVARLLFVPPAELQANPG